MDILNMHRVIEQKVQRLAFFAYKDLESEEVDIHINDQIDVLLHGIIDKFQGRELKIGTEQGFQQNQVSLDNLRTLHVKDETVVLSPGGDTDEVIFTLPDTYYHYIKCTVKTSYPCTDDNGEPSTSIQKVDVRIHNSQFDLRNEPLYKTGVDSPLGEIAGNVMTIYKDNSFDIVDAKLSYIRKPAIVKFNKDVNGDYQEAGSVHCDLDSSLHQMLTAMTSLSIMKILEANQQKIVNLQQETV